MNELPRSRQHISGQFNAELDAIKSDLLEMGGKVESQIELAAQAMSRSDSGLAAQVLSIDREINDLEISIDEQCLRILARRQPAAGDLRLVIAITRVTTDLERMGDEASRVAKLAIKRSESGLVHCYGAEIRLERAAQRVMAMLYQALDAFARLDMNSALGVVLSDTLVDEEYAAGLDELQQAMAKDRDHIPEFMDLVWSLRSFERLGDHTSNIAEQVVYLVSGEDIRHFDSLAIKAMMT